MYPIPTSTATSSKAIEIIGFSKFHFVKTCETKYFYDHDNIGPGGSQDSALLWNTTQTCYNPFEAFIAIFILTASFILLSLKIASLFHKYHG